MFSTNIFTNIGNAMKPTGSSPMIVAFILMCGYVFQVHNSAAAPDVGKNEIRLNDSILTDTNTFVKCKIDEHCSPNGYCHTTSGVCTQCFNCTQYFRKNNDSNVCIRNIDDCGPCLPGYQSTLRKDRWCGRDLANMATEKHTAESKTLPLSEIHMKLIIFAFCCTCFAGFMYIMHYKRRVDSGNVNVTVVTYQVPYTINSGGFFYPPPPKYTEPPALNECTLEGTIQFSLTGPPSLAEQKADPFVYEGIQCR